MAVQHRGQPRTLSRRARGPKRPVLLHRARTEEGEREGVALEDRFAADGHWSAPPRPWQDPERRLASLELRDELRDALASLPERQRLAVTLRDVEGLDSEEVCEVMGVAPGNERVLLHRARTLLREVLEESLAGSAQLVG